MRIRFFGLALVLLGALPAHADEGMWTFDNLPIKQMKERYGFVPDAAWLEHARLSTVQVGNGCTGSFVSESGLIMTNHHCVEGCLRTLSALKKRDVRAQGYLAKNGGEEAICPAFEATQLLSTEDVTAKIVAATKDATAEKFHDALTAEKTKLEGACVGNDAETIRCDVIDLYHGGQYVLYRYKRYTDVRLVFTPEVSIAAFGGDPDNFNFPRYDLDVAFLRAYEGGKPATSPEHFGWRSEGAKVGEEVFVTGHPGSTDRLLTVAELEYARDVELPRSLQDEAFARGMYHELQRQGGHLKEISAMPLMMLENGVKVSRGELATLLNQRFIEKKRADERALRAAAKKDPALKQLGDPWAEIEAALAKERELSGRLHAMGWASRLFGVARTLVRAATERPKPNGDRLPEFADDNIAAMQRRLLAPTPMYPELEQRSLATAFYRMREELGPDDAAVKAILGTKSPESRAAELVKGSKLFDPAVRKVLWEGGQKAIDASTDPIIQLAKATDAESRALRKRLENEVQGPRQRASERVAKGYFAVHKRDTYPDATFTLRLSYGAVKGWKRQDGVAVAPLTTIGGAFDRATGEEPFDLPASWLAAKPKLALGTPFNFVTDNDIVGGNSGSPMIDKDRNIVGLAFDGNIDSIGGNYWFDPELNRCVGVHPGAIIEALRVVYGAPALADEIMGRSAKAAAKESVR